MIFLKYSVDAGTPTADLPTSDSTKEVFLKNDNADYLLKFNSPSQETIDAVNADLHVTVLTQAQYDAQKTTGYTKRV